jgi:hypothetical protein
MLFSCCVVVVVFLRMMLDEAMTRKTSVGTNFTMV